MASKWIRFKLLLSSFLFSTSLAVATPPVAAPELSRPSPKAKADVKDTSGTDLEKSDGAKAAAADKNSSVGPPKPKEKPQPPPKKVIKITKEDARVLLLEFSKAQFTEAKALRHRQNLQLQEIRGSQKQKSRVWERLEQEQKREFFQRTRNVQARRRYIRDASKRKKTFYEGLKKELAVLRREQDSDIKILKRQHQEAQKSFRASLKRFEKPDERLWPPRGI